MNIQQIRQSLKQKWIDYYYKNRSWLVKVRVWGTYDGVRRPASGFILATASVLEPQLEQILPFIVDLNSNPDGIIAALGLNFNPEEELHLITKNNEETSHQISSEPIQEALLSGIGLTPSIAHEVQHNTELVPEVSQEFLPKSDTHLNGLPLEQHPTLLTPCVDSPEEKSKSIPSVAIATSTLESKKTSTPLLAFVSSEVESRSNSASSVAVAPVLIESKSQTISLLALLSSEVESKSFSFRSTQMDNKSKSSSLAAIATYDMESKSRPLSMVAVVDSTVANDTTPHFSLATDVENKDSRVTISEKNLKTKLNLPPPKRVRHLANWVDEFCQGKGWSKEEDNIMP
jgi:Family of unknown function (DUF5331)